MDIFQPIKQWCNVGIVVDSDADDVKFVLMLTANGFTLTEYMTATLGWKAEGTTFAIRRLDNPLAMHQSLRLRKLATFLSTLTKENGKY